MYLFGISMSNLIFCVSLSAASEIFCGEAFESFVYLSAILLPIKSPVASLFQTVLSESAKDCLA